MKKVYKAHILFTKEKDHFEVFENGYIAVEDGFLRSLRRSAELGLYRQAYCGCEFGK